VQGHRRCWKWRRCKWWRKESYKKEIQEFTEAGLQEPTSVIIFWAARLRYVHGSEIWRKERTLRILRTALDVFFFLVPFNCVGITYSKGLGHFANHSQKNPNAKIKVIHLESLPRLYPVALRVIEPNEEIWDDLGETGPTSEWQEKS